MSNGDKGQAATIKKVPDSWPGAFGIYKYSKKAVMVNLLWTLVFVGLLSIVTSLLCDVLLRRAGSFASILIESLIGAAFAITYLASVRGKQVEFGDVMSKAVTFWWRMLLLYILLVLSITASIMLLIIPFFFVFPRLTLATYFLVDKDMGPVEAYKASWAATKDNVGKIYGIVGVTLLMVLLCVTIIGIPFAIYLIVMYSAAYAELYEFLQKAQPVKASASSGDTD